MRTIRGAWGRLLLHWEAGLRLDPVEELLGPVVSLLLP